MQALDDEFTVFKMLRNTPVNRSFPTTDKLNCSNDPNLSQMNMLAVKELQRVLQDGSIPFDRENPGILRCYEMGWIHSEPLDADGAEIVCVFPSKLHEKYYLPLLSSYFGYILNYL